MENVTLENVTLERAVEVVRALRPEEQQQLRRLMDSWQTPQAAEATPEQERQIAEHLFAKGLIVYIPERYHQGYVAENQSEAFTPIKVIGRPVSETLLEDRGPK